MLIPTSVMAVVITVMYSGLTAIQLFRGRCYSAKQLAVGVAVCFAYMVVTFIDFGDNHNAIFTQMSLFLVASAWAYTLDWLKAKSASIGYTFMIYQLFMVLDCYASPMVETAAYSSYPMIVYAFNAVMMLVCFSERGDHDRVSDNSHVLSGNKGVHSNTGADKK